MPDSRTINIAGAGPAGLTAAINLARAGYEVVVHEQHEDTGMRFSEDFQALENWTSHEDVLETIRRIGFEPSFYCRPGTSAKLQGFRITPLDSASATRWSPDISLQRALLKELITTLYGGNR